MDGSSRGCQDSREDELPGKSGLVRGGPRRTQPGLCAGGSKKVITAGVQEKDLQWETRGMRNSYQT